VLGQALVLHPAAATFAKGGSANANKRALTRWIEGYIRLSLFSTAQPLCTRFPIIFSTCFSKVTIGYYPRWIVAEGCLGQSKHPEGPGPPALPRGGAFGATTRTCCSETQ
jgi:hypothetical protein